MLVKLANPMPGHRLSDRACLSKPFEQVKSGALTVDAFVIDAVDSKYSERPLKRKVRTGS